MGHSDADVIVHAVADSLLGAAGLGDIGMHFPDSDPAWAGADSLVLLERVIDLVGHAGWRATNVDAVVVAEEPMLARWRPLMQVAMSEVVDAPVTVKGKRAEGLGSIGRSEGIACWAVALIEGIDP